MSMGVLRFAQFMEIRSSLADIQQREVELPVCSLRGLLPALR